MPLLWRRHPSPPLPPPAGARCSWLAPVFYSSRCSWSSECVLSRCGAVAEGAPQTPKDAKWEIDTRAECFGCTKGARAVALFEGLCGCARERSVRCVEGRGAALKYAVARGERGGGAAAAERRRRTAGGMCATVPMLACMLYVRPPAGASIATRALVKTPAKSGASTWLPNRPLLTGRATPLSLSLLFL